MENLKILVSNEAESKEAQELFFKLGAKWRSQINREEAAYVINTEYPSIILHGGDMSLNWNTIEQFNSLSYYKEITLQELRDMVNPMKEYLEKQADGSYKLVMRGIVGKDDDIEVPEGAEVAVYPHFSKGISFFKNNFRFAYADSSSEWKETDYCPENLKHWKSWRVAWKRHTQPEELPFLDSLPEFKHDFGASSLNDQYAEIEQVRKHRHYFKDVSNIAEIDVYAVLKLFDVTDPCLQHIVKKALCAGKRGHKDMMEDLQNIVDTAIRAVELNS